MRRSHEGLTGITKDSYGGLPEELKEFNYYYQDCGHVIMSIVESALSKAIQYGDLDMFECPVPCKYVLEKGYRIYENHVVVDCKYDDFMGLVVDSSYYECDEVSSNAQNDTKFIQTTVGERFFLPINQENMFFDTDDTGANLIIGFYAPTQTEIAQFDSSVEIKFKLAVIDNVLFLLVKIGNLNWMDASYNPTVASSLNPLSFAIMDGNGIPMWIYFVDVQTNILKAQRLVVLGTKFSKEFQRMAKEISGKSTSVNDFNYRLANVYKRYSTKDLLNFSSSDYRAGEK